MKGAFCLVTALLLASCGQQRAANAPTIAFEAQPREPLASLAKSDSGPQMFFTPSGKLYLLAGRDTHAGTELDIFKSDNGGDTFEKGLVVAPALADAMTMGEMGPIMLSDPSGPWVDVLYEGGGGKLYFARSYMFGRKPPRPIDVVQKRVPSANEFATMGLAPNGNLYVAWLDGRRSDHNPPNTFSVYVARSIDHGKSFETPVRVDLSACPCCRPTFAFGDDGTVYLAWRKDFPSNIRDIVLASSHDGEHFSAPLRVSQDHWSIDGCPDSGPALKTVGKRLYVAWYTQGSTNVPQVRTAYTDDMQTFSQPRVLSTGIMDANHPKFVAGTSQPLVVLQGRAPGSSAWSPLSAFLVAIDGDTVSAPESIPAPKGSLTDPIGVMSNATSIYVAATEERDGQKHVVLIRGRAPASTTP